MKYIYIILYDNDFLVKFFLSYIRSNKISNKYVIDTYTWRVFDKKCVNLL